MELSAKGDSTFVSASTVAPYLDFQSGQQKFDSNGIALNSVRAVVFESDNAEVITIRFPGAPPKGIAPLVQIRVVGLTVVPWNRGDRAGLTYKATSIEALGNVARQAS